MDRICIHCCKEFSVWPSYIKRGGGIYCSRKCRGLAERGKRMSPATEFKLGHKQPKGKNSPHWKDARTINKQGYIVRTYKGNLVLEHRLVAEEMAGRKLKKGEVVHHINGKRDDNRPDNLLILNSHTEHMKLELKNHYWLGK